MKGEIHEHAGKDWKIEGASQGWKSSLLEDWKIGSLLSKMAWTWPLSTDTANIPVEFSDEFSGDTESFAANYAFDPQDVACVQTSRVGIYPT